MSRHPTWYWHKLHSLTRLERLALFQAAIVLPVISLALRLLGFRRVFTILGISSAPELDTTRSNNDYLPQITEISGMVDVAARRSILQPTCLERSLALWLLLHRRHIASGLRIGVRMRAGALEAHAWIESHGYIVNDTEDISQRYAAFERLLVPQGVDWR